MHGFVHLVVLAHAGPELPKFQGGGPEPGLSRLQDTPNRASATLSRVTDPKPEPTHPELGLSGFEAPQIGSVTLNWKSGKTHKVLK